MSYVTRFWFRPDSFDEDGFPSLDGLAAAFVKAGHGRVLVDSDAGAVGLVPFEVPDVTSWEYVEAWVGDMESHFGCSFVESR